MAYRKEGGGREGKGGERRNIRRENGARGLLLVAVMGPSFSLSPSCLRGGGGQTDCFCTFVVLVVPVHSMCVEWPIFFLSEWGERSNQCVQTCANMYVRTVRVQEKLHDMLGGFFSPQLQ